MNRSSIPPTQQIIADGDDGNVVVADNYEIWMTALSITVAIFSSVMCFVGIFFMVTIFRLRKFTFNLYIIFAIFPDCLNNGILGVSLFIEALQGSFMLPLFMCKWLWFQMVFFYFSNIYVNAVIAKEVMVLVRNSYHRRRILPPSTARVVVQAGLIYALMGLYSGFNFFFVSVVNDPICRTRYEHAVCGMASNVLISLPPFLYTFWVAYKIWKDKLLPLQGRTRALALYFWRIIVIFVAFFLPILVLTNYVGTTSPEPEGPAMAFFFVIERIFFVLMPIQNIVTLKFLLQKDDISMAIRRNTSLVSASLLFRLHGNNNEGSTNDATVDGGPISEWDTDDIYESDIRKSNDAGSTAEITMVGVVVANVGNNNDIACSKDLETGNEQNTKAIDVLHPSKEDIVEEEEPKKKDQEEFVQNSIKQLESEVEIVFERTSKIENEDLEEGLEEVESEVEIVFVRTSEIENEDLEETIGRIPQLTW